jgi:hypothetical protein
MKTFTLRFFFFFLETAPTATAQLEDALQAES